MVGQCFDVLRYHVSRAGAIGLNGWRSTMDSGDGSALAVGDLAPDFHLPSNIGREIALSEYRGTAHVALFFVRAYG